MKADMEHAAENDRAFVDALRRRLYGMVVVLGGGLFLLLIVALGWFTLDQDRQAQAMSRHIAGSAMLARVEFMNRALTQYAVWDDPIEHVLIRGDKKWMDDTIGTYVFDELHVEQSFVVDAAGHLHYAMRNRLTDPAQMHIDPNLQRLAIDAARKASSVPLGQILLVDGRPSIVGIQKLAPSTGKFASYGDTGAAMVFVDYLDDPLILREIELTYALDGLRFSPTAGGVATGSIPLHNSAGGTIGWLSWDQYLPGQKTMKGLAPIIALLALSVAYVAAAIGGTVRSMVEEMLKDRRAADHALVRAKVALEAAQAAQGDAERMRRQLHEVENAHAELDALRRDPRRAA